MEQGYLHYNFYIWAQISKELAKVNNIFKKLKERHSVQTSVILNEYLHMYVKFSNPYTYNAHKDKPSTKKTLILNFGDN